MGIWKTKWIMWNAKVDLDQISTPRKVFFKTKPTIEQIEYLDMIDERNSFAWGVLCFFSLILGILIGWAFCLPTLIGSV